MVLNHQSATQIYSLTLSLICPLISNNCCLRDSSSRCGSVNASSEFLRFKFWISILYSFRNNCCLRDSSSRCELFSQCVFWISSLQILDLTLIPFRQPFCDIDLQHWSQNLLFLLCVATVSRLHHQWETWGFKHWVNTELACVLVHGFREVGGILVRIENFLGIWLGRVAKLRDACAEWRMSSCKTFKVFSEISFIRIEPFRVCETLQ